MAKKKKDDDDDDDNGGEIIQHHSFGSCYGNDINWESRESIKDFWNIIQKGMITGELHHMKHDGKGTLTIELDGTYLIAYSASIRSSISLSRIQIGIIVSGKMMNHGIHHWSEGETVSNTTLVSLKKNDRVEIGVRTTDPYQTTILIEHFNLSVVHVGDVI